MKVSPTLAERLRKKSEPRPNGCIEWTGWKMKNGYGSMSYGTQRSDIHRLVHRIAYELANGEIPEDKIVMHACDNRLCINVHHLRLGTCKDNTQDMVSKGRHWWRNPLPWQKLSDEQVEKNPLNEIARHKTDQNCRAFRSFDRAHFFDCQQKAPPRKLEGRNLT